MGWCTSSKDCPLSGVCHGEKYNSDGLTNSGRMQAIMYVVIGVGMASSIFTLGYMAVSIAKLDLLILKSVVGDIIGSLS